MNQDPVSSPLRLMMLSQGYPPSDLTGAPLQAHQLAVALRDQGASVDITTNLPLGRRRSVQRLPNANVQRYIDLPGMGAATRFLRSLCTRYPGSHWDVVHGHALSPLVLAVALAKTSRSAPLLVKPSLGGAHGEGEIARILESPARSILLRAMHKVDMFAVLDDLIDSELEQVGIPREKRWRVSNGVDLESFRPIRPAEEQCLRDRYRLYAKTLVLYCGQLSARKGLPELMDAWQTASDALQDGVLVICGDGPLRERVIQRAGDSNGRTIYLGPLEQTAEVMRLADVLVLPSRFESFGNVVVEALASGVPVAATPTGVVPEVLDDGIAGWIMPETSTAALKDVFSQMIQTRSRWSQMGSAGRHIAERYSFSQIAADYLTIYRGMLSEMQTSRF